MSDKQLQNEVEKFNKSSLKKAETQIKDVKPTTEDIEQEKRELTETKQS